MTLKEFQDLTSLFGIGFERFTEINRIYMQTGDLDKKEFCEEFMRVLFPHFDDCKIVKAITERAEQLTDKVAGQQHFIEKMKATLLQAALDADAEETWSKVTEVLGPVEVIRYKLDNQLELTDADRAYIINHLKDE